MTLDELPGMTHDLIVIGAGPAGMAAATAGAELGLSRHQPGVVPARARVRGAMTIRSHGGSRRAAPKCATTHWSGMWRAT